MSNPRELMRHYGAPAPQSIVMPTEIRSDGGLKLQLLSPPGWSSRVSTGVIVEWACEMDLEALEAVSILLRRPDIDTGLQAEDAMNQALTKADLGNYLGTFIDEGRPPYKVRVQFALRPKRPLTDDQLTEEFRKVLSVERPAPPAPATMESQAATALRALRDQWWHGQNRSESRSMLLSLTNIESLMDRSLFVPHKDAVEK